MFDSMGQRTANAKAGKVSACRYFTRALQSAPELPPMAESGFPESFHITAWFGLLAL